MNEIIAYAKGYGLGSGAKVFLQSAKAYCDKLTLLGLNLNDELIKYASLQGCEYIDTISSRFNVNESLSPYTLKVIYFYLYCKHISTATHVYLSDFTDVFFQRNVFDLIKNRQSYVTTESCSIIKCDTNRTWIQLCYNADVLQLIGTKRIINGGHIFGARESVVELLEEMCVDMFEIISRIGNYPNIDQACLNKTVYFDEIRYNILSSNEVLNMAHTPNIPTDVTPYVLHQYDVNKPLTERLYKQYE